MNDRFKFRAWNKDKKIMCYDNEDDSNSYFDGIYGTYIGCINLWFKSVNKYEFMQCTGLKDKNKNLIFEGDIINIGNIPVVICWVCEGTRIQAVSMPGATAPVSGWWCKWPDGEYTHSNKLHEKEIIGNIHDNPELLKDGEANA